MRKEMSFKESKARFMEVFEYQNRYFLLWEQKDGFSLKLPCDWEGNPVGGDWRLWSIHKEGFL